MTSHSAEIEARATRLVELIKPMIAAELLVKPIVVPTRGKLEDAIMEACKAVGKAVDRIEQVKFTAAERQARRDLETAARRLRTLMNKREKSRGQP